MSVFADCCLSIEKGVGLIGVDLLTGKGVAQVMFKDRDPDYKVDELAGRLLNLDKNVLTACQINETVKTAESDDKDK